MANDLFTLGLNVSATKSQMDKQLKQIAKELSDSRAVQVTGGLNLSESQKLLQSQLNTISKNLKVGVEIISLIIVACSIALILANKLIASFLFPPKSLVASFKSVH